ncbi:hypothetical protein [Streptomyces sp. Amel2xC10]|uniref:hypothetical protein n=1 Tax=Streptomyces sp. Amel2xC10 TaxID=1305826 RepID=UPI000A0896F6|nr:hypothetical protein [Streptomyces sp. Amel2xC10]SME95019.1 hypothetical protein SAMN02745830_00738 [Streptomyces sp. Amel2xC10]
MGRFRFRPVYEAADEVTRGGRMLVAYSGHRGWVNALCTVEVAGRELLASAGRDGPIRLWDLQKPHRGHGWVRGVCQVRPAEGPPLIVTAGYGDGPRVWDVTKEIT